MANTYQIELTGVVSLKGNFEGATREEAIGEAKRELRQGEIGEVYVNSCIYIDPDLDDEAA